MRGFSLVCLLSQRRDHAAHNRRGNRFLESRRMKGRFLYRLSTSNPRFSALAFGVCCISRGAGLPQAWIESWLHFTLNSRDVRGLDSNGTDSNRR